MRNEDRGEDRRSCKGSFAYYIVKRERRYRLGIVARSDIFYNVDTARRVGRDELESLRKRNPFTEYALWIGYCEGDYPSLYEDESGTRGGEREPRNPRRPHGEEDYDYDDDDEGGDGE